MLIYSYDGHAFPLAFPSSQPSFEGTMMCMSRKEVSTGLAVGPPCAKHFRLEIFDSFHCNIIMSFIILYNGEGTDSNLRI
jgi:hypothetical protein